MEIPCKNMNCWELISKNKNSFEGSILYNIVVDRLNLHSAATRLRDEQVKRTKLSPKRTKRLVSVVFHVFVSNLAHDPDNSNK